MTIKEKLELVLNTPEKVYLFSIREVRPQFVTTHALRGRLIDYRGGVLYIDIDTGIGRIKTLQFQDLTDIRLPDLKPITQNKIGFDV